MRVYKLKRNFDCVSCLFLFIQFYKWNDQLIALVRIEIIKKEFFFSIQNLHLVNLKIIFH